MFSTRIEIVSTVGSFGTNSTPSEGGSKGYSAIGKSNIGIGVLQEDERNLI